jgi:hypothetical protein
MKKTCRVIVYDSPTIIIIYAARGPPLSPPISDTTMILLIS